MVCFYDRNQLTRQMGPCPICVEIPAGTDHGRQLARAIGNGERLIDARQAHWRESLDFDFRQLDLVVDMWGVAQRSEFKDARYRQSSRHPRMIQQECRQMPASRPARDDDGPGNTMLAPLCGEPVEGGSQLACDLSEVRVGG